MLKILRNWGIQSGFLTFLFSLWLWRICSLIVISAKEQTLLKRGWHNICGWSNILVRTSDNYHLINAVRFIKKIPEGQKKCEKSNTKCNMENVRKKTYYSWYQINIRSVNSKYHTMTDHTNRHMKIHTIKKSISLFSVFQKMHLQEPHEESC